MRDYISDMLYAKTEEEQMKILHDVATDKEVSYRYMCDVIATYRLQYEEG